MKSLYAIALILAPLATFAHGPAEDSVLDKSHKGVPATAKWKKADDQIIGKFAKPQLIKMKATAESLHSFLQDSCFANTGINPIWHGEYIAGKTTNGIQLKYGIKCEFNGNATLGITINDMSVLTGHYQIDHQDLLTIPVMTGTKNDCPYFEVKANGNDQPQSIWLVTPRPDVLPYTFVTRKEYLDMVIGDLNITKEKIIADVKVRTPVHTAEEQAAEKKRDLDELSARYSGNELQLRTRRYLDQYKSDDDYLKENIDKATADVDTTIHMIQGMLDHLSPATLAAPAIVSPRSTEFEGFRDGEPDMVMLIRPNPSFYEPGAAQEKPQFFLITWNGANDANDAGQTNLISKHLDTRILKNMLK